MMGITKGTMIIKLVMEVLNIKGMQCCYHQSVFVGTKASIESIYT